MTIAAEQGTRYTAGQFTGKIVGFGPVPDTMLVTGTLVEPNSGKSVYVEERIFVGLPQPKRLLDQYGDKIEASVKVKWFYGNIESFSKVGN